MDIIKFTPVSSGSMIAYVDVEMPSGMIGRDFKLMRGPAGEHWVAMPSVKETDRDGNPVLNGQGKPRYREFIGFRDRQTRDKFTAAVLEAVRRKQPETLAAPRAPTDLDDDIPL
jgi:DNA-binding cell septation regulator SpoVG